MSKTVGTRISLLVYGLGPSVQNSGHLLASYKELCADPQVSSSKALLLVWLDLTKKMVFHGFCFWILHTYRSLIARNAMLCVSGFQAEVVMEEIKAMGYHFSLGLTAELTKWYANSCGQTLF